MAAATPVGKVGPITYVGLALALAGPGLVALASRAAAHGRPTTLAIATPWLAIFAGLIAAVWAIARFGEGLELGALGFGRIGWLTLPIAVALAAFFIFVFGPTAYWFLVATHLGSFGGGESTLALLPRWFLIVDIVVVAAGEEWLYRAYAIERLQALVGRPWLAGALSRGVRPRPPAALGTGRGADHAGLRRRLHRALSLAARHHRTDPRPRHHRPLRPRGGPVALACFDPRRNIVLAVPTGHDIVIPIRS